MAVGLEEENLTKEKAMQNLLHGKSLQLIEKVKRHEQIVEAHLAILDVLKQHNLLQHVNTERLAAMLDCMQYHAEIVDDCAGELPGVIGRLQRIRLDNAEQIAKWERA